VNRNSTGEQTRGVVKREQTGGLATTGTCDDTMWTPLEAGGKGWTERSSVGPPAGWLAVGGGRGQAAAACAVARGGHPHRNRIPRVGVVGV